MKTKWILQTHTSGGYPSATLTGNSLKSIIEYAKEIMPWLSVCQIRGYAQKVTP